MPKVYAIDGIVPVVHPSAFVHESAALVGMNAVVNDNAEVEVGRKRIDVPGSIPLSEMKAKRA